jgi:hypothetical protein
MKKKKVKGDQGLTKAKQEGNSALLKYHGELKDAPRNVQIG